MATVELLNEKSRVAILVTGSDMGIMRVASYVADDIRRAIGKTGAESSPDIRVVVSDDFENGALCNADFIIVAGTIDEGVVAKLFEQAKDESARLKTGFEQFCLRRYDERTIVVGGSDALGAQYGLLHFSKIIGVSPWHYFADVEISQRNSISVEEKDLYVFSKRPSVEFRGFFLNDEWPSLGSWVHENFGGFNELFYEKIFDLLLRLNGNFLWPAMWTGIFSEDGKAFPTAVAKLASELHITMGTSHHEPLFRAGEEFLHLKSESNDIGYGKDWSFYSNERGLKEFWTDSVKRNKDFNSLITIGMRGERDSLLLGENAGIKENIDLLKSTIVAQKQILKDNGLENAPKVLALYKEVEDYYYGDKDNEGLSSWNELDDVTLLLSDDNYGNLRTVPSANRRERDAGWEIYYHFDYHGEPISYEWVNSSHISKIREQLTDAYEYGIRKVWIANVGDLKPCELPLSFFMSLAYDFDKYSDQKAVAAYTSEWVMEQFSELKDTDTNSRIEDLINRYTSMNSTLRPEATHIDSFRFDLYDEGIKELSKAKKLVSDANDVMDMIPKKFKDRFFELVYFPAKASANIRCMMLYAELNKIMFENKASSANYFAKKVDEAIALDKSLEFDYNNTLANGKWRNIMKSKHVAFINWNDEGSDYPKPFTIDSSAKLDFGISVDFGKTNFESSDIKLGDISSLKNNYHRIIVQNIGEDDSKLRFVSDSPWLDCRENIRLDNDGYYLIKVDFDKVPVSDRKADGMILVTNGEKEFKLYVSAIRCGDYEKGLSVETLGTLAIASSDFVNSSGVYDSNMNRGWMILKNYGKFGSVMKHYPLCGDYESVSEAPYLEYRCLFENSGTYDLTFYFTPSNNRYKNIGLKFAYEFDGKCSETIDALPEGFMAGYGSDKNWSKAVLCNHRKISVKLDVDSGEHLLRFYALNSGLVLSKIEFAKVPADCFYGVPFDYSHVIVD